MKTKMKTRSAAKKRFKVTGSGKILRRKAGHSHLLSKKSASTKRNQNVATEVSDGDIKNVRKMLAK